MSGLPESDSENPFAAPVPVADEGARVLPEGIVRPPYQLYTVGLIVLAAFCGTILAGGVLLAINYWRLGRRKAAWVTLLASIAAAVQLVLLIDWVPDTVPSGVVSLPQLAGMYFLARALQGKAIAEHERSFGETASPWAAVGIGLVSLAVFLALAVGIEMLQTGLDG